MSAYIDVDNAQLFGRLNPQAVSALESAGGWAFSRTNYEVTPAHLLGKLIEDRASDVPPILQAYDVETGRLARAVENALEQLRTGSGGDLTYSPSLMEWVTDAWLLASVDFEQESVRSGIMLLAALKTPGKYFSGEVHELLGKISAEKLREQLLAAKLDSSEQPVATSGGGQTGAAEATGGSFLEKYTLDFTQSARDGSLDPVFGREHEIRQMLDILGRRRKNNPIVVGEAGTGKTAVVEGLALRIVQDDVPDSLKGVALRSLDLGLLQAGASVKGEFEKRLQGVIEDVKASPTPIILFIDEAHTLIGAGGQAGGSDAANLLKPALARGELRTIAATTWAEYKKYFEKDPALTRRFQPVKLDEPDDGTAALILRGLRDSYEKAHGVVILDSAIEAAAKMASKYIPARHHPDKGVDLLDTAAARVKLARAARPAMLQDLDRRMEALEREARGRERDREWNVEVDEARLEDLRAEQAAIVDERENLEGRWQAQRDLADKAAALHAELVEVEGGAGGRDAETIRAEFDAADGELRALQENELLVPLHVDDRAVASAVSDWTGIPLGNMIRGEAETLLNLESLFQARIRGQDMAIETIANGLRAAKSGLEGAQSPGGVFLLVGPSGVGKTETALTTADLLYGGEQALVTINMSEFQESHTVSRLVGSPPGYVGYGEGGVLTEAVRKRPYSAVLFDEVEKAHKQVANIFYQMLDKGTLADGEGRVIDFKNTTIFLTSNLGTDVFHELFEEADASVTAEQIVEAIRPSLREYFAPALLGRMTIVPYLPLPRDVIRDIVDLKLSRLAGRLRDAHRVELEWTPAVADALAARCNETESGARNVDNMIRKNLHPVLSDAIVRQIGEGQMPDKAQVDVDGEGFVVSMDTP